MINCRADETTDSSEALVDSICQLTSYDEISKASNATRSAGETIQGALPSELSGRYKSNKIHDIGTDFHGRDACYQRQKSRYRSIIPRYR